MRRIALGLLATSLVLVAWQYSECQLRAEETENSKAAHAALIAYEANMTSLRSFKCRYTYTMATTFSVEKALRGEYDNVRKCEFLYVADGEAERFEAVSKVDVTPPKTLDEAIDPRTGRITKSFSVDFIPIARLRNGHDGLRYNGPWATAKVRTEESALEKPMETPLSLLGQCEYGLPWKRRECDQGKATLTSRGIVANNGRPEFHAQLGFPFRGKAADGEFYICFFDPTRGYLPDRIVYRSVSPEGVRNPEQQVHLLEAKMIGKDRWFPMHVVSFFMPREGEKHIHVTDVHVTELVMDKVTEDDLSMDVPAGTLVTWENTEQEGNSYFTLRQNEKLSPKDISRIKQMLGKAPTQPLMDTAVKTYPKSSARRRYLVLGALGAMVILTGIAFYYHRRRLAKA